MKTIWLTLTLQSDAAFGRGDGVAGLINAEVQHDDNGFPYMGGKTLKGLLGAACGEIIFAMKQNNTLGNWEEAAQRLFGGPGSGRDEAATLHVGDAQLPDDLRTVVADEVRHGKVTREEVLDSLTALRRQTAMNAATGAPQQESLRTIRVILREMTFTARLDFFSDPKAGDLPLLAACVRGLKRAGSNRNRGLGRLEVALYETNPTEGGKPVTHIYFDRFSEIVKEAAR